VKQRRRIFWILNRQAATFKVRVGYRLSFEKRLTRLIWANWDPSGMMARNHNEERDDD